MREDFKQKSIFMVGGPGGVGKTTLAAALGIQLASAGYKTVVLTVDPARRLAQALGFDGFKTDLQKVEIPGSPGSSLHATMLDTQRYFDKIVHRFAKTETQKERILTSPIYRTMVDSLGGTNEYAAMERLLEFTQDSRFEKIVVDTPPTQNAVDLLSAPQRLADFMDNSVLRWFQGSKAYLQLFRTGTKLAIKMVQRLFGAEFMESFSKFMDDLEGMQAGFRQRNLEVLELLRSPRTAFLLVTFPSEVRYLESVDFMKTLKDQRIPLSALILNRVERPTPEPLASDETIDPQRLGELNEMLAYYHGLYAQQKHWVDKFRAAAPALPLSQIHRQEKSVHDIGSLSHLGSFLVD